jgi:hypothetical protein
MGIEGEELEAFKEVVASIRLNIRCNSRKPVLLRHVFKTISIGLRNIPGFKESELCWEKQSFAKTWSALQFVACLPSVAGERSMR